MIATYSETYLVIDLDRCWGCGACQVACKQEHDLGPGAAPLKVVRVGPEKTGDGLSVAYVPVMCQHCDEPACTDACPVGAITKESGGWVLVDRETCLGCGACADACPYGAMRLAENAGQPMPVKCDACRDRREQGLPPSCVQHCIGRAIALLPAAALKEVTARRRYWSAGKVVYIASEWCTLGEGLDVSTGSRVDKYLSERRNSRDGKPLEN